MADSKTTALTETTSPATTDLLYVVTTPGGTPASKKATIANVVKAVGGMVKIATLGSGASFDFTSIPGTYTDLKIIVLARGDTAAAGTAVHLHFNNDSAGNYDSQTIDSNNTTNSASGQAATANNFAGIIAAASATANMASSIEITIPAYASTTFYKRYICTGGTSQGTASTNQYVRITEGEWRNTAAITRVTLVPGAGNFAAGSTATLYGMG